MFKKIASFVGMSLACMLLTVFMTAVVFLSCIDPSNLAQNFHEQYLTHQSEQYMNTMAEHEKEDKLKKEFGLTWMNHLNDK